MLVRVTEVSSETYEMKVDMNTTEAQLLELICSQRKGIVDQSKIFINGKDFKGRLIDVSNCREMNVTAYISKIPSPSFDEQDSLSDDDIFAHPAQGSIYTEQEEKIVQQFYPIPMELYLRLRCHFSDFHSRLYIRMTLFLCRMKIISMPPNDLECFYQNCLSAAKSPSVQTHDQANRYEKVILGSCQQNEKNIKDVMQTFYQTSAYLQ